VAGTAPTATGTSFVWNWNNAAITGYSQDQAKVSSPSFDPKYPTTKGDYPNWEWPMSYEFKLPRTAFSGNAACTGVDPVIQVITIHNSPGKTSNFTNVFGQSTVGVALVE
jgi:hypothetical protein